MTRETVVGVARCAPGHQEDVARAAAAHFLRGAVVPGRADAYLFETEDDPTLFVYVARWASRAAFEGYARQFGQFGEPAWYAEPHTAQFYEPLATYVEMYARSEAVSLALVDVPTGAVGAVREHLLAYHRSVSPRDLGAVEYEFGEAADRLGAFLALARWRGAADLAAYRADGGARLVAELAALGASVRLFAGPQRAETPWETPA